MGEERVTLSREALYELVWAEPMLKVAEKFGVSSSYLARVCTALNVPRPERGYWAKVGAGHKIAVPPLPPAQRGDVVEWIQGESVAAGPICAMRPPERSDDPAAVSHPSRLHGLVARVKPLFEAGRLSYDLEYLKPAKRLLPDLVVSKGALDKALEFANSLFTALEARGHRVVIAGAGDKLSRAEVDEREATGKRGVPNYRNHWSPNRPTVAYFGDLAIGLTIFELSESVEMRYVGGKYIRESDYVPPRRARLADYTWTSTRDAASGRLCLQAYSPYWVAKWQRQWREEKARTLGADVDRIVRELEGNAPEVRRLVEEGERAAELERQRRDADFERWQLQEAERHREQMREESRKELLAAIEEWAQVKRIETFLEDLANRLELMTGDERVALARRINEARQLLGSSNAADYLLHWRSPEER